MKQNKKEKYRKKGKKAGAGKDDKGKMQIQ
jgi:hypothetical protein